MLKNKFLISILYSYITQYKSLKTITLIQNNSLFNDRKTLNICRYVATILSLPGLWGKLLTLL